MKVTDYQGQGTVASQSLKPVDIGISDDPEDQLMILNVLSNTLYTDKISAVWREYGCNAFDANVEAGRAETPIEITLPSKLDPTATIRDFGFGMTREQVLQVFCKLGRSTKRQSNEYTGMLGIGSKAGFAYGDSFLVTSYSKGLKVIYNCFRDRGAPRLAEMHQEASNAPEGIEIKVPVRLADIPAFMEKAERVFRYFKVRPIIHGQAINFDRSPALFEGKGWRYVGDSKSYAIMGNVGYKIDSYSLTGMAAKKTTLLDLGVELDFTIGELEIAANREGLQYKDLTSKSISTRLDAMIAELAQMFTAQIKAATCLWDAKSLYGQAFERMGHDNYNRRSLRDVIDAKVTWNGKSLGTARMEIGNKEKDPEVMVSTFTQSNYGSRRISRNMTPDVIFASPKTTLVINDLPSKKLSPTRVRGWFDLHKTTTDTLVVFTFQTDAAQKRYWKRRELEGAPTVKMSTIPPSQTMVNGTPAAPSAHRSKHSARAFLLDEAYQDTASYGRHSPRSMWWQREEVNLKKDGGIYVRLEQFQVCGPAGATLGSIHPQNFQESIKQMRAAGLLKGKIYAFKRDAWPKLGSKWQTLEAYLAQRIKDLVEGPNNAAQELADFLKASDYEDLFDVRHQKLLPTGTIARQLVDQVIRMRSPQNPEKLLKYLHSGNGRPWVVMPALPKATIDLDKLEADVIKTYPMLRNWSRMNTCVSNPIAFRVIVDYINLVENS